MATKHLLSTYLIIFIGLLAISSARGNYGYGQQMCDKNVYSRAREMIRLEMQQRSIQPPQQYPPQTNGYQANSNSQFMSQQLNDHQCKLIRQGFDDMLVNTPLCESIGSYQFQNSANLIQQCRTFLIQYCERNQGWQYSQCYKKAEINNCENQFNLVNQQSYQNKPLNSYNQGSYQPVVSYELCQAFENFRNCVVTVTRMNCYSSDQDYLGTFMVDKAQSAAWSCIPRQYQPIPVVGSNDPYSRRTDLTYPNQNQFNAQYPPYNQPIPNNPAVLNNGLQPLPTYHQSGNQPSSYDSSNIDRFGGALTGIYAGSIDVCIQRVRPFENQCTDHLIQRQKEARYGRSSNDVQRRICCALFYYRDCLSRIVLERCVGSTRMAVDILLGDRNREIVTSCRDVTRDQCNSSNVLSATISSVVISVILTTFLMFITK